MVVKAMLEQGCYEVDPQRVADAIIARWFGPATLAPRWLASQNECSKPASSPVESAKPATG